MAELRTGGGNGHGAILIWCLALLAAGDLRAQSRIAFVSDREGNAEIYTVSPHGDNLKRLTDHPGLDLQPAWSPGGAELAFVSNREGRADIWLMQADGSGARRLTNMVIGDKAVEFSHPSWLHRSRDTLVFQSEPGVVFATGDIWLLEIDSMEPRRMDLTNGNASARYPIQGASELLYIRVALPGLLFERPTALGVYGFSDVLASSPLSFNARNIDWAPATGLLAFDAEGDIWMSGPYTQQATNLTLGEGGLDPSWSPDGQELVYVRDGMMQIMATQIHQRDGMIEFAADGEKRALSQGRDPDWSPVLEAATSVRHASWGQIKGRESDER